MSDPASVSALATRLHRAARTLAARAGHLADARDEVARWPGPAAASLRDLLTTQAAAAAGAGAAAAEAASVLQGHAVDLAFARSGERVEAAALAADASGRLAAALARPTGSLREVPSLLAAAAPAAPDR